MDRKIIGFTVALMVVIGGIFFYVNSNSSNNDIEQPKNNVKQSSDTKKDEEIEKDKEVEENSGTGEQQDDENDDLAVGKEAPNFTLKNLEGKEVSLSDYKGKIVLINFWATWCKYCDIEMPDIQKISDENEDVVVLAVDVMEDKKTVSKYIEKGNYDFEVVLDEDGDIARTYLVSAYPTTYFVDKEGKLIGGVPGMMKYAQINEILGNIREK